MDTYNLLPENEYKEAENRRYLNPNLQVDATNTFIDNLRSNQQANNAQITMQTRNLGTQVPSNLGGLTGGTGYFTSRYQTPQTNAATQNLRTAAQAAALNQALANEKAYWQKRYQDAYRAQQKSAYDKANTPTGDNLSEILKKLGIDTNENEPGTEENNDVSIYDPNEVNPLGKVTMNTSGSLEWVDPKTGYQYLLKSPREIDAIAAANSFAGAHPTEYPTQEVNGRTLVYNPADNMWYERGLLVFGGGVR